ncbi:MAG: hypothetical protein EXS18_07720 [Verrucomicrobiae bacterium]|nr:hypothetical protein [Verrucomicrobiae bacterium]
MKTPASPTSGDETRRVGPTIFAGVVCWAAISLGFLGLKILMQERPQFVGQPMTTTKAVLVQESPQVVVRKMTEDVSVIKPTQPESSEVQFTLKGRRDYRGLKTISDMSGDYRAAYVLTNGFEESLFVLFKCAHPRADRESGQGLLVSGLLLQASTSGVQENLTDAWLWSGTIAPHSAVTVSIGYKVGSLRGVTYKVREQQGNPVKHVRVTLHRQDLNSMRCESGDGANLKPGDTVVWERNDFLPPDFFSANIVERRNLFVSLSQLLEIGPLVCLLFLLAVLAAILVRQPLTVVQVLTISAGYALYFPLILYLSSRFSFAWALIIAVLVPGALLVNYARWLLGGWTGVIGAVVFLALYQVFPTLAAFAGWNRGMVLLALGVVTLWVLINLQNQALRRGTAAALIALLLLPSRSMAGEVQVIVPGELLAKKTEPTPALISYEPAQYLIHQEATHLSVEVKLPLQVLRASDIPVALFGVPVHLSGSKLETGEQEFARLVTVTNRLSLFAGKPGKGTLHLSYRVPVENREGKKRAQIPLLLGPSSNVRLESARNDVEILTGSLWSKSSSDKLVTYDIGVAGEETLVTEWRDQAGGAPLPSEGAKEFYGIGVTRAQHLTVIHSDGGCTHFAEYEVPVQQAQEFRMKLPAGVKLISVSVNGTEIAAPPVESQLCQIRLPNREAQQTAHRLSFRLNYPPVRLGFVGVEEIALPELFQTVGTLEWVLALPAVFDVQIISSGLEIQKSPPDLTRFGDYGRILKSSPHTFLAKNLAPPGLVNLHLKYRQIVPGISELRPEESAAVK